MWVFGRVEWEVVKRGMTGKDGGVGREIVVPGTEHELEEEMEMGEGLRGARRHGVGHGIGHGNGNGFDDGRVGREGEYDVVFEAKGQDGKAREV